jgi:AhpD family alkylhydroperoxidase
VTRLTKLTPEEFDPELRELVRADEKEPLELGLMRIFAHRPEAAKALARFSGTLRKDRLLPDRLIELVRLRVAFFNQCRSCMAIRYSNALDDGLTEDLVCSLERPHEAADLTDAEKAAVRYGELFATNHLAIDDAVYDDLRRHFSEEQIVELGMHVAFFVGFGRLAATWHMVEELPERFAGAGLHTPWGGEAVRMP